MNTTIQEYISTNGQRVNIGLKMRSVFDENFEKESAGYTGKPPECKISKETLTHATAALTDNGFVHRRFVPNPEDTEEV